MAFVGNDVVDRGDPANLGKSRDARFLDKVFHREEQEFIRSSADPDGALWVLWAVKEAAWKAAVKAAPENERGWKGIRIRLGREGPEPPGGMQDCRMLPGGDGSHGPPWEAARTGVAETFAGPVSFDVRQRGDCIHAIGILGPYDPSEWIAWQAGLMSARGGLLRDLNTLLDLEDGEAVIHRVLGPPGLLPPRLFIRGEPSGIDISLSHDGRFAAWAFRMPPVILRCGCAGDRAGFRDPVDNGNVRRRPFRPMMTTSTPPPVVL